MTTDRTSAVAAPGSRPLAAPAPGAAAAGFAALLDAAQPGPAKPAAPARPARGELRDPHAERGRPPAAPPVAEEEALPAPGDAPRAPAAPASEAPPAPALVDPAVPVPVPAAVPAPVPGLPVPDAPLAAAPALPGAPVAPLAPRTPPPPPAPPPPPGPALPVAPEGASSPNLPAAPGTPLPGAALPAVGAPDPAAVPAVPAPSAAALPGTSPATLPSAPRPEVLPSVPEAFAPPAAPPVAEGAPAPAAASPAGPAPAPAAPTAPAPVPASVEALLAEALAPSEATEAEAPAPSAAPGPSAGPAAERATALPAAPPLASPVAPERTAPLYRATHATAQMLHLAAERGVTHARLNLRPVELGGIEIRLQSTSGGLAAQVVADSPEAARLLQQASDDLRRALQARDVTLLSLDVSTSGRDPREEAAAGFGLGPDGGARSGLPGGLGGRASSEAAVEDGSPTTREITLELPDGVLVDVLA